MNILSKIESFATEIGTDIESLWEKFKAFCRDEISKKNEAAATDNAPAPISASEPDSPVEGAPEAAQAAGEAAAQPEEAAKVESV